MIAPARALRWRRPPWLKLVFGLALCCAAAPAGRPALADTSRAFDPWLNASPPGQEKAPSSPAVLRTADFQRSDPRLAGIILRCNKNSIEPVIVVVEPFPPKAQPKITLRVAGQESYFTGSILPTGVGIRLPMDGAEMAGGAWLTAQELEVTITEGNTVIGGVIGLSGLPAAIGALRLECVQK